MDTCFLDVFHDCADYGGFAIGDAIDIDFDCVLKKPIDEHGAIGCDLDGARHIAAQIRFGVNKLHCAPTQHETRPHQHWVTNFLCDRDCFLCTYR